MSKLKEDISKIVYHFMCQNCSISFMMSVDSSRIMDIDGKKILMKQRCFCDPDEGVLKVVGKPKTQNADLSK